MPIYEYRCNTCGHKIEKLQRMDAPAPQCQNKDCEQSGQAMTKIVSQTNFELKGGGWAKDGYG